MRFSKIYLQKNFVPDVVTDPFGRESIGIEVMLDEGEDIERAEQLAKEYINNYINKNTQYPEHSHIEERFIPDIQKEEVKDENETLIRDMESCLVLEGPDGILSFRHIAMSNDTTWAVYLKKYQELKPQQDFEDASHLSDF